MKPLEKVKMQISEHLEEISKLFNDPKITIVVRTLDVENGDLVMTDDDLDKAIAAINVLKNRPKI